MKKGFTLVELLGTITILGVIVLIAFPIAKNIIKDSKEELYEVQISNISDALKNWSSDNSRLLPEEEGETITITLGQLKAGGYVDAEIRNPINNKCFGNDMLLAVTRHQKNYIYDVIEETNTETDSCDNYLKPYIILNGDAIVYVEVGSEYVELGASAIGTDGVDISSNITTSINGIIDTSVVGNSYTVTYTIAEGETTTSINRKVIVNDTIPPELTIPDNVILEKRDNSFNVMAGVSSIDNSGGSVNITAKSNIAFGISGEYIVIYTAVDTSGNKTIKKRAVNIKKAYGNSTFSSDDKCVLKGNDCEPGTLVEVYVNDNTKYNFYVISDDSNELTLIMDRNLGNTVAWYSDNNDETHNERTNLGPITALNYLNKQTEDWHNISAIGTYEYNNNPNGTKYTNGYQKLKIINGKSLLTSQDGKTMTEIAGESKARLLSLQDVEEIYATNNNVIPKYLYVNDSRQNYWFLTTSPTVPSWVGYMEYTGAYVYYSYIWHKIGIRPVITLSK